MLQSTRVHNIGWYWSMILGYDTGVWYWVWYWGMVTRVVTTRSPPPEFQ